MTVDEIKTLVESPPYDFLRNNEHLKGKIIFMCLGGSHAYGTNIEGSDVDLRGCALNSASDILGLSSFEQVVDNNTDTTVFAFNKLVHLLTQCNPNVIEMLGCKPEHYWMTTAIGIEMITQQHLFLSQRAAYTFGGYAFSQLRRLENAIARDKVSQPKKEEHIRNSIEKVIRNFNQEQNVTPVQYSLYVDDAAHDGMEAETFIDVSLQHYPVRDLKSFVNDINNVINDYSGNLRWRNRKKDDLHLNKHAMHLIRLYLMCIDILTLEKVITYREKDHDLLMDIRHGKFQREDGTFDSAFFDMVNELSAKMEDAKKNTSLPKSPDYHKIEEFVMDVNRRSIM